MVQAPQPYPEMYPIIPVVKDALLGHCYYDPHTNTLYPMRDCFKAGHCRNGTLSRLCPVRPHAVLAKVEPCTPESLDRFRRIGPNPALLPPTTKASRPSLNRRRSDFGPLAILFLLLLPSTLFAQTHTSQHFQVTVTNGTTQDAKAFAEQADYYRSAIYSQIMEDIHPSPPITLSDWPTPWPVKITINNTTGGGMTVFDKIPSTSPQTIHKIIPASSSWQGTREALLNDVIPHEVCHTVIHTLFPNHLPRWFDEGYAQCWESESSQQRVFKRSLALLYTSPPQALPFNQLLSTSKEYHHSLIAQYDQSYAVVLYLLTRYAPRNFFYYAAKISEPSSYSDAYHLQILGETYGLDNNRLQISWLTYMGEAARTSGAIARTVKVTAQTYAAASNFRPLFGRYRQAQPYICIDGQCYPADVAPAVTVSPRPNVFQPRPSPGVPQSEGTVANPTGSPSYNPPAIVDPSPPPSLTPVPSTTQPCPPCDLTPLQEQITKLEEQIAALTELCKDKPTPPTPTPAPPKPPTGLSPPTSSRPTTTKPPKTSTSSLPQENGGVGVKELQDQLAAIQADLAKLKTEQFSVHLKKEGKIIKSTKVSPISGQGSLTLDFDELTK